MKDGAGNLLGAVRPDGGFCTRAYTAEDAGGSVMYRLSVNHCHCGVQWSHCPCGPCKEVGIHVRTPDGSAATELLHVNQNCCTTGDMSKDDVTFLDFPAGLDVRGKAVLMAATMVMDRALFRQERNKSAHRTSEIHIHRSGE